MENIKKKTVWSKIAVAIVIGYYACGILALVSHSVGIDMHAKGQMDGFRFWHNKVWKGFSQFVIMVPLIGALPNLVLNIIGMTKEKRVFPFLICIIAPVFIWFVVAAVATVYF